MKNYNRFISMESEQEEAVPDELVKAIIMAYCDEMTASLQYMMAKHQARGSVYKDAVEEYEQHEHDEHEHAEKWLERLEQLGVIIRLDYEQISKSGNEWTPIRTSDLGEQLDILIKAEAGARDFYGKIVDMAREKKDWITEALAKQFMADEEEHRNDLVRIKEEI